MVPVPAGVLMKLSFLVWLLAPWPSAQAACVALRTDLPPALQGCVTAAQLCTSYRRALAEHTGDRAISDVPTWRVVLRGQENLRTSGFSLEMAAFAAGHSGGRRTFIIHAGDCAALPDTLALMLLLLGDAVQEAAPTGNTTVVSEQPKMRAKPTAATVDREPNWARRPRQVPSGKLELGAAVGFYYGVLPSMAPALQLHAAILHEPVTFRLGAGWIWPQTFNIAEGQIRMRDYEVFVEACPGLRLDGRFPLALRLCAGPRFGLIDAQSRDFVLRNEHITQFFMYVGLLPEASVALATNTWLRLDAGAAVAVVRPRFTVGLEGGDRSITLATFKWLRAEIALRLVQIF